MARPSPILVLVFALLVPACSAGAPPAGMIPTVDEARGMLDRVVGLARAGDFDGLCALGDGNCGRHLETAGRDAIPGFETESIRVDHNLRNTEPPR